jgi:hypothetical protein
MTDTAPDTSSAYSPGLSESKEAGGSLPPVPISGGHEIYPDRRMPHLDQGPIKAYAAKARNGTACFALICERNLTPQSILAEKYYTITSSGLLKLFAAGVVDWPVTKDQRFVLVYESKLGNPVMTGKQGAAGLGLRGDVVLNTVVRNLAPVLKDMRDSDFVHGNIRAQNLYDGGVPNLEKVMLGDCLASPPGYLQPSFCESIERAAAFPLGRGVPGYEDDMYSFGVMLTVLMRHHDPFEGMSDEEMVEYKIEHGSFVAMTSKERFSGGILELLRGLLIDDPRLRWTTDDVLSWLDGNRVSPKQGVNLRIKASRPIDFAGEKYLRPQVLALKMPYEPSLTAQVVEGGSIALWLNRSLQDKATEKRFEEAVDLAQQGGAGTGYVDRLSSYVSMSMAPCLPIIYRNVRFMPEAFGRLLVDAYLTKKDLNPFVDLINNQMVYFWTRNLVNPNVDVSDILTRIETCRSFLRQKVIGYGLERCAYYLAPESPCLSEKFRKFYIRSGGDMFRAFESLMSTGDRPEGFLDRHVAAFLCVHDRGVIEPYLPDLNSDEKHRHIFGVMRVLAVIQKRDKIPAAPGISSWICDRVAPLIDRFHDREKRRQIRGQIDKLRDKGDVAKIAALFENVQDVEADAVMYRQAIRQYQSLKQEYARLENELENNPKFGQGTGRQVSTAVAAVIAAIVVILYLVSKIAGSGGLL